MSEKAYKDDFIECHAEIHTYKYIDEEGVERTRRMTKKEARRVYDEVFETVATLLESGMSFTVRGFGEFSLKEMPQTKGHDFINNKDVIIPPYKKIVFRASDSLKERINDK